MDATKASYDLEIEEDTTKSDLYRKWSLAVLVIASELLGIASIVLCTIWMETYIGFSWQSKLVPKQEYSYHPTFMTVGLIFLYGNAIICYRVFRNTKKMAVKILHAVIQGAAVLFIAVGTKAIFDSHNLRVKPKANMYSIHSWVGIFAIGVFGLQWIFGALCYLAPWLSINVRKWYMPHHVFWGLAAYVLSASSYVMGIFGKKDDLESKYATWPNQAILMNILGTVVTLHGIVVIYIATRSEYKRPAE